MTETKHKNVYVALAAAQTEMEPVVKGSVNPAFKSKYADLADLVLAVRPALNKNGLAYFHQIVRSGDATDMRTTLMHGESETRIDCDVPLIVSKNDMQGMKSATTYAKRIGLESVTGVAPEDDDGNAAAKAPPEKPEVKPEVKGPTKETLTEAANALVRAETLDALAAMWGELPREVKASEAVIAAKDFRKTELTAPKPNADLDDHIPYA